MRSTFCAYFGKTLPPIIQRRTPPLAAAPGINWPPMLTRLSSFSKFQLLMPLLVLYDYLRRHAISLFNAENADALAWRVTFGAALRLLILYDDALKNCRDIFGHTLDYRVC